MSNDKFETEPEPEKVPDDAIIWKGNLPFAKPGYVETIREPKVKEETLGEVAREFLKTFGSF